MQSVNGAQSLNITSSFLSSARFALAISPYPVTVTVLLLSIYASLLSHKLDFSVEVLNLI